jgi:hypothetical protein
VEWSACYPVRSCLQNEDREIGTGSRSGNITFWGAVFDGSHVTFFNFQLAGGKIDFNGAMFSRGEVSFEQAFLDGSKVTLSAASFCGGIVSFEQATSWSVPAECGALDNRAPSRRSVRFRRCRQGRGSGAQRGRSGWLRLAGTAGDLRSIKGRPERSTC